MSTSCQKKIVRRQRELLHRLVGELLRNEKETLRSCRREVRRLGHVPPAWALGALANHVQLVRRGLDPLAASRGLPAGRLACLGREMFAVVGGAFIGRLRPRLGRYQRLLGTARAGGDLVRLVQPLAELLGDAPLVEWCAVWLGPRLELVQRAELELSWFAYHTSKHEAGVVPLYFHDVHFEPEPPRPPPRLRVVTRP